MTSPYYVIMATQTPLYAPLYLAKQARLDSIFHRIEFRYGSLEGSGVDLAHGGHDQLVHDVLTNSHCLAGVADPFRALPNGNALYGDAFVMSGLIQHMFFWLINRTKLAATERQRIYDIFERIVVSPDYMTGYKIARHDLVNFGGLSLGEADQYLFSNTVAGFEEKYCQRLDSTYKKCRFAYVTPNVLDFLRKRHDGFVQRDYALEDNYRDSLMTGLIVSRAHHANHPELYEGLQAGINAAVEMIYRDPTEAAWKLREYRDSFINFSDFDAMHDVLRYLVEHRAFPKKGEITTQQIRSAAAIRNNSSGTSASSEDLVLDDRAINRHFAIAPTGVSIHATSQSEAKARLGAWVEEALSGAALAEAVANTRSVNRMLIGMITSSVLIALEFVLLIFPMFSPDGLSITSPKKVALFISLAVFIFFAVMDKLRTKVVGSKTILSLILLLLVWQFPSDVVWKISALNVNVSVQYFLFLPISLLAISAFAELRDKSIVWMSTILSGLIFGLSLLWGGEVVTIAFHDSYLAVILLGTLIVPVYIDTREYFEDEVRMDYRRSRWAIRLVTFYAVAWAAFALAWLLRVTIQEGLHGPYVAAGLFATLIAVISCLYARGRWRRIVKATRTRELYEREQRERAEQADVAKRVKQARLPDLTWFEQLFPSKVQPRAQRVQRT